MENNIDREALLGWATYWKKRFPQHPGVSTTANVSVSPELLDAFIAYLTPPADEAGEALVEQIAAIFYRAARAAIACITRQRDARRQRKGASSLHRN